MMQDPRIYDRIGVDYARQRCAEPAWQGAIVVALDGCRTVVNVGAGAGSYEPEGCQLVAVEPSLAMIRQRPPGAADAVCAQAEALPFRRGAFDAAMAILTIHHWMDVRAGLGELCRVAERQLILTWDAQVSAEFWLIRDYLPEIARRESVLATLDEVVANLAVERVVTLPVPADCSDGVLGAYWRRPEAYLDPMVRAAISGLALLDQALVDDAMSRLRRDLDSRAWQRRHAGMAEAAELDLGYRLVLARGLE